MSGWEKTEGSVHGEMSGRSGDLHGNEIACAADVIFDGLMRRRSISYVIIIIIITVIIAAAAAANVCINLTAVLGTTGVPWSQLSLRRATEINNSVHSRLKVCHLTILK